MKLTKRLLKEQIKKTLKEASTFEKFYYEDPGPEEVESDGLTHSERKQLAAEEEEIKRLQRKYQSAEDRERELYMQGQEDAQTIVVRSPRRFKKPQHSSEAYMAGYRAGELEQKRKDAEQKIRDREIKRKERERAIKRTGLGTPNSEMEEIWNFMMIGGGEITANANDSMFRNGWLPYLRAKMGKRWTRTPTSELKKEWQQGLFDEWKNQYATNMREIKSLQGFLRRERIRHKRLRTKDQQWWVDELSNMGQRVLDKIVRKHKSGILGKAASFLGLEESMTLSSDDIRKMIREEMDYLMHEMDYMSEEQYGSPEEEELMRLQQMCDEGDEEACRQEQMMLQHMYGQGDRMFERKTRTKRKKNG